MTDLVRVSVVAGDRRTDLAVPPAVPVAELVAGLAGRLSLVAYEGLLLHTVDGRVLDDAEGLQAQQVTDGTVLVLTPLPPPPPLVDDPVEAVPPPPGGRLPAGSATVGAAATLLALGAVVLTGSGEPRAAAAAALLLTAAAVTRRTAASVTVAGAAASGYAAVAAASFAVDVRPGAGVAWSAAAGAALAVASLVMAAVPVHRLRLLPVLVAGAAAALVGATQALRDVPLPGVAAALLVAAAVGSAALPWLAVGRIERPRGRVDVAALGEEVRIARELLVGLAAGLGLVQVALVPVVVRLGAAGAALAGCACLLTLLRARHPASSAETAPALVAGAAGLVLAVVGVLWLHEPWRLVGGVVVAVAGAVLLVVPPPRPDAPLAATVLRTAETACLVALLPLLAVATGALGLVS